MKPLPIRPPGAARTLAWHLHQTDWPDTQDTAHPQPRRPVLRARTQEAGARQHSATGATASISRVTSHSLLQGAPMLLIEHNGIVYQLRTTRQGKLILTK